MATHENTTKFEEVTETVKSALSDMSGRVKSTIHEVEKLQDRSIEQTRSLVETATRVTQEQIAFAEQIGTEWRKLMLAATRSATDLFTRRTA